MVGCVLVVAAQRSRRAAVKVLVAVHACLVGKLGEQVTVQASAAHHRPWDAREGQGVGNEANVNRLGVAVRRPPEPWFWPGATRMFLAKSCRMNRKPTNSDAMLTGICEKQCS